MSTTWRHQFDVLEAAVLRDEAVRVRWYINVTYKTDLADCDVHRQGSRYWTRITDLAQTYQGHVAALTEKTSI